MDAPNDDEGRDRPLKSLSSRHRLRKTVLSLCGMRDHTDRERRRKHSLEPATCKCRWDYCVDSCPKHKRHFELRCSPSPSMFNVNGCHDKSPGCIHPCRARACPCPGTRVRDAHVDSHRNRVHFIAEDRPRMWALWFRFGPNLVGLGQKKGEGVAATLPRKERRTLWKTAQSTSSTPQPNACHRFPAAKVFACDHVVKRSHVGHTR